MRVLLMNPTMVNECDALHLGIGALASYLNARTEHRAEVVDFVYHRNDWQGYLRSRVERFRPDVFAATVSSPYYPVIKTLAAELRTLGPQPIVLGGAHVAIEHARAFQDGVGDFVIRGEGEESLARLLDVLPDRAFGDVKGLVYRDGDQVVENGWAPPVHDLTALPPIDWDLWEDLDMHLQAFHTIPAMGSRGCPFHCSICTTPWISRNTGAQAVRFIEADTFVDQLADYRDRYRRRGGRLFFLYDLNFMINVRWVERFCAAYIRRGLTDTPFSVFSRVDHVTPEVVRMLKAANCSTVRLGVESGNDFMRNEIYEKDVPREAIFDAVATLKAGGITTQAYLVLGGPGETEASVRESLTMMRKLRVEYPTPFLFKVLAGNPIQPLLEKTGARLDDEAMQQPADYLTGHHVINPGLSAATIERLRGRLFAWAGFFIVLNAIRTTGFRFFTGLLPYVIRGRRFGWSWFQCLTYYVYYGCGNLERPLFRKAPRWLAERRLPGKAAAEPVAASPGNP